MGIAIGAGVAAAGVFGYMGSQNAANAGGSAASAQQDQATRNRADIFGEMSNMSAATTGLSQSTPQELNILGQSYGAASQQLSQQQQLMNSINPALMEASKQALQILRGGQSAMSAGVMSTRNAQRSQLMNTLRSQYGPGAETSSIGQRALQQFDMQTQQMQQGTLNNLMGIAGDNSPNQGLQSSLSGLQQVGQGYSALQNRQLNTQMNLGSTALGALSGTGQQMLQTAGAPYVGAALQGQGQASLGNNLMNTGAQLGMAYGMRGPSAAPGGYNPAVGNPAAGMQGSQEGGFFGSANPYG